jgi:hypothetical protein
MTVQKVKDVDTAIPSPGKKICILDILIVPAGEVWRLLVRHATETLENSSW